MTTQLPKVKFSWTIQIGNKLNLLLGTTEDQTEFEAHKTTLLKKAQAAMLAGNEVKHDGTTQWIDFVEVFPAQWDEAGQKTRHTQVLCVRDDKTGLVSRFPQKVVWRDPLADD